MVNLLNRSAGQTGLSQTKFLSILAISGMAIGAAFLHADSGANQPVQNQLTGSWLKPNGAGGLSPIMTTFLSDGSLVSSRCIKVPTGPASAELISGGHGTWARTGHNEFTATTYFLRSGIDSSPDTEFTGIAKTIETLTLNRAGDELTRIGTLYIYDADNNLLFPPGPPGGFSVSTRIVAE